MISFDRAKALAEESLAAHAAASGDEFVLLEDKIREVREGWIFFYNSSEFMKTGNPISGLAGNGPILVDRHGTLRHLPSGVPWQDAIRRP
jgi:hypothetical protein